MSTYTSEFEEWLGIRYYFVLIFYVPFVILYIFSLVDESQLIYSNTLLIGLGIAVIGLWIILVVCYLSIEYLVFRLWNYLKERRKKQ